MSFFTDPETENLMEENFSNFESEAKILKALAHPVRLCIVRGLLDDEGCNVSKMQQCLDIPQSTLSQHLAKLRDADILSSKRNGLERNYYVISDKAKKIVLSLND